MEKCVSRLDKNGESQINVDEKKVREKTISQYVINTKQNEKVEQLETIEPLEKIKPLDKVEINFSEDDKKCKRETIEMKKKENINEKTKVEINTPEILNNSSQIVPSHFYSLLSKPLPEDYNMKKNIEAKNFHIIDKDMLINIVIILEKIIVQLITFYNENNKEVHEQLSHFQSFFKILYKLLNNIYLHPHEKKFRTVKFSNNQVRSLFFINYEMYGTLELLFQILKFNTSYYDIDVKEDSAQLSQKESLIIEQTERKDDDTNQFQHLENFNLVWKFENDITDEESILFEFVLSSIRIILNKLNNERNGHNKNEIDKKNETCNNIFSNTSFNEQKQNFETTNKKKLLESPLSLNKKIAVVYQKNEERKKEIEDIRKLHDERYKLHKMYGNQQPSYKFDFTKGKDKEKKKKKTKKQGVNVKTKTCFQKIHIQLKK